MQVRDLPLVTPARPVRAKAVHFARVGLVVALLAAIPSPSLTSIDGAATTPAIDLVRKELNAAERLEATTDGRWIVEDAVGESIAQVARTLPEASKVVGYRGPTEALIVLSNDLTIASVSVLQSADTREHVEAVINDTSFLEQFQSWDWHNPPVGNEIDGVSGATLTSLAFAEGILMRMGGDAGSLVFSSSLSADEVKDWFPEATSVVEREGLSVVQDSSGKDLGRVFRSGPHRDDIIGYQGPTELLLRVDGENRAIDARIRESFDNEPYVDYVRKDQYSWSRLTGRSLSELAELDLMKARVEGVSGATMTSLAVAETMFASAKSVVALQAEAENQKVSGWSALRESFPQIRWTSRDVATLLVLVTAAIMARLKWFRYRYLRRIWLVIVVAVIGGWSGNLVSMALVAGWSAEGIAWQLAPGLAMIAVVALAMPPLAKTNPYCNHLCPHGAVQQLIKPSTRSKRKWHVPPRVSHWLTKIPGATLVIAYIALVLVPTVDLSSWEPFHAYLFRIAGWGSIAVCLLTLGLAMIVPMGYCRMGCPTGRLIDYLRRSARSDRIDSVDFVAIALLCFAVAIKCM